MMILLMLFVLAGLPKTWCLPSCSEFASLTCTYTNCPSLVVTCNPGFDLPSVTKTLKGRKVEILHLKGYDNPVLPGGVFTGNQIKKLVLESPTIKILVNPENTQVSPFAGLEDQLEVLEVIKAKDAFSWMWEHVAPLRTLKKIIFSESGLFYISDYFLKVFPNIMVIDLQACNVHWIDKNAFRHLKDIRMISLKRNSLKKIQPSYFSGQNKLWDLDLSYNQIEIIQSKSFDNMPELSSLHLDNNKLTELDFKTFHGVWKTVRHLWLHENPLHCSYPDICWLKNTTYPMFAGSAKCSFPKKLVNRNIAFLEFSEC
ncbi:leucine-rich repeat-containing protein 4C-like [Limulus polyphemus]|uniref:Leucine-rich repeat-containing protein 4C-like n=1 Tax=Limulus polyphemus TaxID=6850 RepID=A0ABM1S2M7_LIMPO|nr:leucine-rich repeat-containing protein 4C-like [Limulus polyphemus]